MKTLIRSIILLGMLILPVLPATVELTWQPVIDATSCNVFWSTNLDAPVPWSLVGASSTNRFQFIEPDNATNYYAVQSVIDSAAYPLSSIAFHPRIPTGLAITKSGQAYLLSWQSNPASDQVAGYSIWWSSNRVDWSFQTNSYTNQFVVTPWPGYTNWWSVSAYSEIGSGWRNYGLTAPNLSIPVGLYVRVISP